VASLACGGWYKLPPGRYAGGVNKLADAYQIENLTLCKQVVPVLDSEAFEAKSSSSSCCCCC
jgi:hypothetical protein